MRINGYKNMADFREYVGVDFTSQFLGHYGIGHEQGGHSGRYPWGSGDAPMQDSPLSKGSESRKFRYVPSKSMDRSVQTVLRKLKENKITIGTIHTAKVNVEQANQEYLSFLGYSKDEDKAKLNREEKTQVVLNVKADNHENRPHARNRKIAEGTAEVKIRDSDASPHHLPAIYATNTYNDYVPEGYVDDIELATIDGTTNEGYRPDFHPISYDTYEALYNPSSENTFLTYYGQEKKKLDKLLEDPSVKLVIGMAKVADKVVNVLKKLKNVVVKSVKNITNRK